MDESVNSRDKGNHPIGPRQGQRNRISTNHFDPTPRTAASYKECCIGEQVEQQKKNKKEKNKRTIIHVDSDHDDSDVEECNGLVDDRQDYVHEDSDLFYESSGEEEEPFMKNKTPAIVTPLGKATTERNIVHSQSVVTTTDSAASKTANDTDLVDSDDDKFPVVVRRTQRKRICTNRFDPSPGNTQFFSVANVTTNTTTNTNKAGGRGNEVRSIILTTVISY